MTNDLADGPKSTGRRRFLKYQAGGAYHWDECDKRSRRWNPGLVARYEAVLRRVPTGTTVLDVGCGDGYLMHRLAPLARHVVGVDPEERAFELASEKLKTYANCSVCGGSGYALPFLEESFDVVILADVIEHLEAPDRCLSEVARVVRDAGTVVVTTARRWRAVIDKHHLTEYRVDELRTTLNHYFVHVAIVGTSPMVWTRFWKTRVGFRVFPRMAKWIRNPLLREGEPAERFAHIVASCTWPRQRRVERGSDYANG